MSEEKDISPEEIPKEMPLKDEVTDETISSDEPVARPNKHKQQTTNLKQKTWKYIIIHIPATERKTGKAISGNF